MGDIVTYYTYDKPGAGRYKCKKCPYEVDIVEGEALPICPVCGAEEWIKVG